MKMRLYVIYDTVSEESSPIFTARTDAQAMRMAGQSLKDVDENERQDYVLYCVAGFDSEQMFVTGLSAPRRVLARQMELELDQDGEQSI